jgi:hypothetical protein
VGAADVERTLSDLSADGWEIVSVDWADHGMHGTVILRRPPRR